jgi:hypothetical protein
MARTASELIGNVTTIGAGAALGVLGTSDFGFAPTLLLFLALTLFASATQRAISRHR